MVVRKEVGWQRSLKKEKWLSVQQRRKKQDDDRLSRNVGVQTCRQVSFGLQLTGLDEAEARFPKYPEVCICEQNNTSYRPDIPLSKCPEWLLTVCAAHTGLQQHPMYGSAGKYRSGCFLEGLPTRLTLQMPFRRSLAISITKCTVYVRTVRLCISKCLCVSTWPYTQCMLLSMPPNPNIEFIRYKQVQYSGTA